MSATASTALVEHSPDASTRGRTILADRVVQKIAARAALEVPGCLGFSRTIIGIDTRRSAVTATAVTDGSITGLTLSIAVAYPAPITTTTRAVRTHVQQRVETLCDLSVDHIDITVAALPRPHRKEARVQ